MIKIILGSLGLLLLLACSSGPGGERLVGRWEADLEASFQHLPEKQRKLMAGLIGSASITIEFRADGTSLAKTRGMGMDDDSEGTWAVIKTDGNRMTIRTTRNDSESKPEDSVITFEDDNTIQIQQEGQIMILRRM